MESHTAMNRYCIRHGIVPADHQCGRWPRGKSNWNWSKQRAQLLAAQSTCTQPGCNLPSTEAHHVTDTHIRAVCHAHNPRGG